MKWFWLFGLFIGAFAIGVQVATLKYAPEAFKSVSVIVACGTFIGCAYFFRESK